MTLINAKRRFEEIGYQVQHDVLARYKCRRIGTSRWIRHNCLEALLAAAREETGGNTKAGFLSAN